ncbi:hypothetical protein SODALDRAFT_288420 [Sodiomyces alkalinus F11]|uniref:Nucleoporin NUP188 n=1 Tax=Sodiomyces alkalinus (strain CBS 110278 / VKM F-3762 / F11) TaxID=1314773 RepID=A0A3N2Q7T4_SODAK|nr:hypothetical protein SODALDRAFT_288420 [Sodiomyces alkalinus F11]ROT42839.1 hypothetical protein SODALDRAFT_288420 [Sodiomyces alkalinus F11]
MAPVSDRLYFPPVEECLKGDTVILSWKLVAAALTDSSGALRHTETLAQFLADDHVRSLLQDPSLAFAAPSDTTKSDFETRTAAIHVTPTKNEHYDTNVIKADATWLSKAANINLVSALRVVIVECQSRPASQLTGPLSIQDAINLQEAVGVSNAQSSSLVPIPGATRDADAIWADFGTEEARRLRIFQTYLSERRYLVMTADLIHGETLCSEAKQITSGRNSSEPSYPSLGDPSSSDETLIANNMKALTRIIDSLANGFEKEINDNSLQAEDTDLNWQRTLLTELVHTLSVIFQALDRTSDSFAAPETVMEWFSLMEAYVFLNGITLVHESINSLVLPIQILICAICLRLLNPTRSMAFLAQEVDLHPEENNPYLSSPEVLGKIHDAILTAAGAGCESQSPVIFAWAVISHRMVVSHSERSEKRDTLQNQKSQETFESGALLRPSSGRRLSAGSIVSLDGLPFDGFLVASGLKDDTHVIESLAQAVTSQGGLYDVLSQMTVAACDPNQGSFSSSVASRIRLTFIDFLKATYPPVGYQSDPVTALLSILSVGQGYWDLDLSPSSSRPSPDVAYNVLQDTTALECYLYPAFSRYPFEFLPFLNFSRALASPSATDESADVVVNILRKTPSLTFVLPDDFQDFELAQEEENTNTFRLLADIPLVASISSRGRIAREEDALRIPAGTYGRFVTDTGRVALLEYEHSALAFLGKRLEVYLSPENYQSELENMSPEDAAEAISLLATLLQAETLKSRKRGLRGEAVPKPGLELLEDVSKYTSGSKDIISVVCNIMDIHMQDDQATADGPGILVLHACVQFLDSVLPLCPTRVWAYMARCELLNSESRAGKLARLVGNLDLSPDRFEFLLSTVRLFSSLVGSVMKSAAQRKSGDKLVGRQKVSNNVWVGVADKILATVTLAIAQAAVDIFESSATWRFPSEVHQTLLMKTLVPLMDRLMIDAYAMGGHHDPQSLTTCLQPAADYVVESFLAASSGSLRFQALLGTWISGLQIPDSTLYAGKLHAIRGQVISTMNLATSLLRVAALLERSSAAFETYLFKATPLFARLIAADEEFKRPAMSLLGALVLNAATVSGDPRSLFGYLGPLLSRAFLQLLSRLGKPFLLPSEVQDTWRFFSIIVQNRQQWMSNCLLTGRTPRDAQNGDNGSSAAVSKSVFQTALAKLESINELDRSEALRVLDFVASAQNNWPWTIFSMRKESSYFASLRRFIKDLKTASVVAKSDTTRAALEAKMAAYVADIFAMQLYHQRQMGHSKELANSLISDLDYYLRDGVEVASYNNSLHNNFARNFSSKYPCVSLDSLKRTLLEPRELGKEYFYALDRANEMLDFDPGWHGRRDDGFRNEMAIANANLSLVDAQISLFHAWEFLLLELNSCLPDNETVHKQMLQVALQCLDANQSVQGPENIFLRIVEDRANLALMLLKRLVGSPITPQDVYKLLGSLFGVLGAIQDPFGADSIEYYRTILKTVYIVLRLRLADRKDGPEAPSLGANGSSPALTQTILNLLANVVAKGFRTLVTLVHESEAAVAPQDLALLTAILQASLRMPGLDQCQTQILNIMASYDVMHAATALFSWSDKLTVDGDPIYGELSLLFLLELSTLPMVAEQLAADGLLSHLTSANITNLMRKGIVSPFSEVVGAQRCYSIWAKGVLPLLLNLLTVLGGTVAPEVAYVLNQFPHLLKTSVERFEAPGASRTASREGPHYVTLLAVSEIHSLALLTKVIAALRVNNSRDIPGVQWDAASMLENVDFWLASRKLLKERLLPLGQREVEWRGMTTGNGNGGATADEGGPSNLLEARVISQLETARDVLSEDLE